ncbi:plant self-incompatibility S1 [Artemisia annua]|uniref:S-protein homolog n=1 Tax=Artemisia annua TaxID=35608 RepID=A0A2U1PNE8_ARTAN|nr:plant self-incompatibility S1 [Artemisia annua]
MAKLLSLFILAINLVYATQANVVANEKAGCGLNRRYTAHIKVDVNNLRFRCQSKDNDLGDVVRNAGEEFNIRFCLNLFKTTLFFCHFHLGSKQRTFDVFSLKNGGDPDYCFMSEHESKDDCFWLVKEDGFYAPLRNFPGPNDWVKRFDWE